MLGLSFLLGSSRSLLSLEFTFLASPHSRQSPLFMRLLAFLAVALRHMLQIRASDRRIHSRADFALLSTNGLSTLASREAVRSPH